MVSDGVAVELPFTTVSDRVRVPPPRSSPVRLEPDGQRHGAGRVDGRGVQPAVSDWVTGYWQTIASPLSYWACFNVGTGTARSLPAGVRGVGEGGRRGVGATVVRQAGALVLA